MHDLSRVPGKPVIVVGGANYDIKGRTYSQSRQGTSNPGETLFCPGGVGRNIAEALARLGVPTAFMGALGDDAPGREILNLCNQAGVDMSPVLISTSHRTGTYLAISGPGGELELALADMAILDAVTPVYLQGYKEYLEKCGMLVADANLPPETLAQLAAIQGPLLVLEAVSVEKARKLLPWLSQSALLAANRQELSALSGLDLSGPQEWQAAYTWFRAQGGGMLLLKLGAQGLMIGTPGFTLHLPAPEAWSTDSTGAGDSLLAGFLAALWAGASLEQAASVALKVANKTFSSPYSVARELHPGLLGVK